MTAYRSFKRQPRDARWPSLCAFACATWSSTAYADIPSALKAEVRAAVSEASSGTLFSPPSLEQRIKAAQEVLRAEGYYGATIEVVEAVGEGSETPLEIFHVEIPNGFGILRIAPMAQFQIRDVQLDLQGPTSPDLVNARTAALAYIGELSAKPAVAGEVQRVQSQILALIKDRGFTQAEDVYPDIVVDHATTSMTITFAVNAGSLTKLAGVDVRGARATPQEWVAQAADVKQGEVASGQRIREIADRLRSTGAYQSVDVTLTNPNPINVAQSQANLVLAVQERRKRTWSAGAQWSTSDGIGLDAATSLYHRLKKADTLTFEGKLGTLESSLGATWRLPSFRGPGRDIFLESRIGQETTDAFDRLIGRLGATYIVPHDGRDFWTFGVGLDVTRTRTPTNIALGIGDRNIDGSEFSLQARYDFDRVDDVLNPTKGWRAQAEVLPRILLSEGLSTPYAKLVLSAARYQPFNAIPDGVLAARLKGGVLLGDTDPLPFDRGFFSGGGGSVRGYAFQSVGPRDGNDNPIGGRTLIEGSVEARWTVRGPFGAAVFVDAARITSLRDDDDQETKFGVGFGLRYNLGTAPLRVDLAVPLNKREGDAPLQIYLSAGQSF